MKRLLPLLPPRQAPVRGHNVDCGTVSSHRVVGPRSRQNGAPHFRRPPADADTSDWSAGSGFWSALGQEASAEVSRLGCGIGRLSQNAYGPCGQVSSSRPSPRLWSSALVGWLGVSGAREKFSCWAKIMRWEGGRQVGEGKNLHSGKPGWGGGLGLRPERPGGFSGSLVFCFGGVVRGVRSQGENSLGPCAPWKNSACCWGERHSGGSGLRPREIQGRVLRLSGLLFWRGG